MQRPETSSRTIHDDEVYRVFAGFIKAWFRDDPGPIQLYPLTNRGCYGFDFESGPMPISVFSHDQTRRQSIESDYTETNRFVWRIELPVLSRFLTPHPLVTLLEAAPTAIAEARRTDTVFRVSYPGFSSDRMNAGLYFDAYGQKKSQIGWALGLAVADDVWDIVQKRVIFH